MADAKQEMNNGPSQSRLVLAKPKLGSFGSSIFGASSSSKGCNTFGSVLRPPQLKPSSNPFLKITDTSDAKGSEKDTESPAEERLKDAKTEAEAPKFVPLGSANVTPRTTNPVPASTQPTSSTTSSAGFVFGQNLSERVVMKENVNNGEANPVDHSSTNGTELLFTNAAASVKENNQEEAGPSDGGEGLAAAAAEYERSHARPPPLTTNCTMTGEEGEINVLQISCRMFAWETGSWRERGRGVLRLNDAADDGARLVARVAGSLRVLINTKLWPGMVVERAGLKSLRIAAMDAQHQIKLFLIMGAPGDIIQLHRALISRIAVSKRTTTCKQNATSQKAAERLEAAADDNEYLDRASNDGYDDEITYEDKQSTDRVVDNDKEKISVENDRLENDQKTDEIESNVDSDTNDDNEGKGNKSLKRKEPVEDETSPKRQCPEILIE